MAIPEAQLNTWSKQGSVAQSQSTYSTVRSCLESASAPYANRSYSIFLQGSYGNDINIYSDSDVDVVILLDEVFYTDQSSLSEEEKIAYERARSPGNYSYDEFKADVLRHLTSKFGSNVKPGRKAILIEGNGSRRDADVLVAAEVRRFSRFRNQYDQSYVTGICFWTSDGRRIINFPKQHSQNCTSKHQNTGGWFKPTVRVFKNMRNWMTDRGMLAEGTAPSYFLEGMLWNVPNDKFWFSFDSTVVDCINWLLQCDKSQLACANDLYWLCRGKSDVTWTVEQMDGFMTAVVRLWNDWK